MNKSIFGLALACASSVLLAQPSGISIAPESSGYAQDGRGAIMRSGDGLCWRSGSWTPDDAVTGCDGALVPPVAKPIAPTISSAPATVTPTPLPVVARCDFTVALEAGLFSFDKTGLATAARSWIDNEVLKKLEACATVDTIVATGHTDRLGTTEYNQKLSAQRAASVVSYLKTKGVTAPTEIRGAGESQPIKTCDGKLAHKKLVACLAPNRRVVVDVRGIAK